MGASPRAIIWSRPSSMSWRVNGASWRHSRYKSSPFDGVTILDSIFKESRLASFFSTKRFAMARDNSGQRNCPVCGSEMTPVKKVLPEAENSPAFSCQGCGVTAFGDYLPKSGRR